MRRPGPDLAEVRDLQAVRIDEAREKRIEMDVVVDAYGPDERATGWHVYLSDNIEFPFLARCIAERRTSPLKIGEDVQVFAMTPEGDSAAEVFVTVRWQEREFGAPLSQLEAIGVSDETRTAIEDWRYWVAQGYEY